MTPLLRFLAIWLCLASASFVYADSALLVDEAFIREAPPTSKVHAGYATLTNTGATDIEFTGASSESYMNIELHLTQQVDGIFKMTPQEAITIKANNHLIMAPKSYHMMLMGSKQSLKAGDEVTITLHTSAGDITHTFVVKKF